jgi:hypothetical protein
LALVSQPALFVERWSGEYAGREPNVQQKIIPFSLTAYSTADKLGLVQTILTNLTKGDAFYVKVSIGDCLQTTHGRVSV